MNPLETWLSAATRGLSEESAAQVRVEIGEHHNSARETALADGASTHAADQAAIAALGDPKSANREYRRVLLTTREVALLRAMDTDAVSQRYSPRRISLGKRLARILFFEAIAGAALLMSKYPAAAYFWLPFIALPLLGIWLPITTPLRGRIFRCAKWTLIISGTALAAWAGAKPLLFGFFGAFIPMAYFEYLRASIRRKLPVAQWPKKLYL